LKVAYLFTRHAIEGVSGSWNIGSLILNNTILGGVSSVDRQVVRAPIWIRAIAGEALDGPSCSTGLKRSSDGVGEEGEGRDGDGFELHFDYWNCISECGLKLSIS